MNTPQINSRCTVCQKPKAQNLCGPCGEPLCKNCAQFTSEETFRYLNPLPEMLKHFVFCTPCFDTHVAATLEKYNQTLEKAHDILVFSKSQGKETRFIKRFVDPIKATGLDEQDVTMCLAFEAASRNFNAVVDVDIKSEKIRDGSYQTTAYSGTAIPANVSDDKLMKDRSFRTHPN